MGSDAIFDIAVIGGGINGAGIAADAAGRGLSVCLLEKGDLAGATSSASTKLVHGGLRYLEHFEFRLVREALYEREVLLKAAPHLITPLRFVLPHVDAMRPMWQLRAGLFLYDHLAKRITLPKSRAIDFAHDECGAPLRADFTRGFAYWDCWADDARLVILNARAAAQKGANIRTRTEVLSFRPEPEQTIWRLQTQSSSGREEILARVIVNAAGPWSDNVAGLERTAGDELATPPPNLRLVKGSHLVVRRRNPSNDAYVMQSCDGRLVFAAPFAESFTLIGTTDEVFAGDPAEAACSQEEKDALLAVYNRFFVSPLSSEDILFTFAGVRPLIDDVEADPSKVTRDYRLEFRHKTGKPALLTVLGGKITTYRKLAQEAVDRICAIFPSAGPAWTLFQPLPGGAIHGSLEDFQSRLCAHYPRLDRQLLLGLSRRHGALSYDVLGDSRTEADMGEMIVPGLSRREIDYLRQNEWAQTAEDVLWRRTKFGLCAYDTTSGDCSEERLKEAVKACLDS